MNIVVGNVCNLTCSYCFAKEMMSKNSQHMSLPDYEQALQWLRHNKIRKIQLYGGEPTLHPDFIRLLLIANNEGFEKVLINSNMTFDKSLLKQIASLPFYNKIRFLPNCNRLEDKNVYDRMVENIFAFSEAGLVNSLGINIYHPEIKTDYIFDIAKQCDIKQIRWTIAAPNCELEESVEIHYKQFISVLRNFIQDSIKHGIALQTDCNRIPICVLRQQHDFNLFKRFISYCNADEQEKNHCGVVSSINYDLRINKCFNLGSTGKSLNDFNTPDEIYNFVYTQIKHLSRAPLLPQCSCCLFYKENGASCGCLKLKEKK